MFKTDHNIIDSFAFDLSYSNCKIEDCIDFEFSIFIIHLIELKIHRYLLD